MRSTIVVCSYNRPIQAQTQSVIDAMTRHGAAYVPQTGSADVALARCYALTGACDALRVLNKMVQEAAAAGRAKRPDYDTVLMVDDDMLFELDQAQELINYTRKNAVPASALYATITGGIAAMPMPGKVTLPGEKGLWLAGLGLLAIPAWMLLRLEAESETFVTLQGTKRAFTSSTCRDGRWYSEDFELCHRLGGVHLLPIAIGHLKTIPIYPDDETVRKVTAGIALPESLSAEELDALEPNRIARNADGGRGV